MFFTSINLHEAAVGQRHLFAGVISPATHCTTGAECTGKISTSGDILEIARRGIRLTNRIIAPTFERIVVCYRTCMGVPRGELTELTLWGICLSFLVVSPA
jgi:hypothetical protein